MRRLREIAAARLNRLRAAARAGVGRVREFVASHADDLVFALGAASVFVGLWMAWPPLGPLWSGGILMAVALEISRRRDGKKVAPPAEDEA